MPSEWTSVRISPGEDVVGQDVTAVCVLVTSSDSRYAQAAAGSPCPTQASGSSEGKHTCASDCAVHRWSSLLAELEPETQAAALAALLHVAFITTHMWDSWLMRSSTHIQKSVSLYPHLQGDLPLVVLTVHTQPPGEHSVGAAGPREKRRAGLMESKHIYSLTCHCLQVVCAPLPPGEGAVPTA